MRSAYIKLIGVAVLVVAGSAVVVVITSGHWWKRVDARVVYAGRDLANIGVYQSPTGELLVNLLEFPDERMLFVIYPSQNKVGLPNKQHFIFLPGYVYSRYVSPLVVFMDTVKAETDPMLAVSPTSVEFTTLRARRVQIVLR